MRRFISYFIWFIALVIVSVAAPNKSPTLELIVPNTVAVNQPTSWTATRTGFHGILSIIVPTTIIGPTGHLLDDTGSCTNIQWQDTIEIQCFPSRSDAVLTVTGIVGPHTQFMEISAHTTDEHSWLHKYKYQLLTGVKYLNHPLIINSHEEVMK